MEYISHLLTLIYSHFLSFFSFGILNNTQKCILFATVTEINYRICKLSRKNETKNCVENFTGVVLCFFGSELYCDVGWDVGGEEGRRDVVTVVDV